MKDDIRDRKVTLAIDFGSKNIGVALVRNHDGANEPLFAGTLQFERFLLREKSKDRAGLRRSRRTRKTKKARLRRLKAGLLSLGLDPEVVLHLQTFSRRRGYKSLFAGDEVPEEGQESKENELTFRFSREEFFAALKSEIDTRVPEEQRTAVLKLCEEVLNLHGDRLKEIRPLRIENRGSSRCAWDGCNNVTPRREHDLRSPLAQFVYTVYAVKIREAEGLKEKVEAMLDRLAELGKRARNVGGPDPKKEEKFLRKVVREELKLIRGLEEEEAWKIKEDNISDLLLKRQGRNRFCRNHSKMYGDFLLDGKQIPFKKSLTERDIVSRVEEMLFQKLWRFLEACVLPVVSEGVDRVVVERAAFDLLGGKFKLRQKLLDQKKLEELYQKGPRYGFESDLEMLRKEFGGLCVYCGRAANEIIETEHILPRGRFFFDSYLDLVSACPSCNRGWKNKLSVGEAKLIIHPAAYEAYSKYVKSKNPPHILHTIKKGILNRMTDPERVLEAEAYLAMIADNFSEITETQRSPRPLARYLSGKLRQRFGRAPEEIAFRNGRHTELWRRAAYPDFDKIKEKEEGGILNHAVDALLMASDLPDPGLLEGKYLKPTDLFSWVQKVKEAAPPAGPNGLPVMPDPVFKVPGFAESNIENFMSSDLALLNWNRKDSKVQRQGAYGWSQREDSPVKRIGAAELATYLRDADKKGSEEERQREVGKLLDQIAHPNLKKALKAVNGDDHLGEKVAEGLISWLRKAIKGSLKNPNFSNHPADQRKGRMLRDFAEGSTNTIPSIIGVRMFFSEHKGQIELTRIHPRTGNVTHRYYSDPANRAIIVAYKWKDGGIDRNHPLTVAIRQSGTVHPDAQSLGDVPQGLLKGSALGATKPGDGPRKIALREYLGAAKVAEYVEVNQGCVVRYENGNERYIRNFAPNYGFKKSLLKRIVGVRRSPFAARVIPNERLL